MQQGNQQQTKNELIQGRIVWTSGPLFEGKKVTDDAGKPTLDENGNQCIQYGFGLSVPKYNAGTNQFSEQFQRLWAALHAEAYTLYPSGQLPPDFAMKFKDGDALDHNGKPFAEREGYKGCIVLACTTYIPIKYFKWEGNTNIVINSGIKCGDYVNVQLNIKAHAAKGRGKAGLYLNPTGCQLITQGAEIINTPSGDQMFGGAAPSYNGEVVPPQQPVMPQGNNMGGMPGMPGQNFQQNPNQGQQNYNNNMPNPGQNFQQNNGQAPAPYHDVLPNINQNNQGQGQQNYNNNMPNPNQGGGMPGQNFQQNNGQQNYQTNMPNPNQNQGQNFQQNNNGGMPPMPGLPR